MTKTTCDRCYKDAMVHGSKLLLVGYGVSDKFDLCEKCSDIIRGVIMYSGDYIVAKRGSR